MKQDKAFSDNYQIDRSTNRYMIEIGLSQYADIFSEWDPAPFKRRAIDPDLELYLESSSDEIPFPYPIELLFMIPIGTQNKRLEGETRRGLENSLTFKLYLFKKELRKTNARIFRFILIGLIFLWAGTAFAKQVEKSVVLPTLLEGVAISGWVFLWEAVSLFFFTNRDLYHRYRIYKRLQSSPVIFREKQFE